MAKVPSLVLAFAAGLGLTLTPARADACSCISPGPACENFWKVEHVFDGTVLQISETTHSETVAPGREYRIPRKIVTFKVHRAYKNVEGNAVEVITGRGGGDCGYDFTIGTRYLVFASRRSPIDGRIEATICSATQPYDGGSAAATWLESLSRPSIGGTIYGSVIRQDRSMEFGKPSPPRQPLDDIPIALDGPDGERRAIVRAGQYRFDGLPPGEYVIRAELPAGLWRPAQPITASLAHPRACAERNVATAINGRITGLLLHADGTPAVHVLVEATPADSDLDGLRLAIQFGHTNEDGRFEIDRLPPGRYMIGVNLRDSVLPSAPYPRTLLPGTSPGLPAIVTLGPGELVPVGTLTLPAPAVLRHIRGTVFGADGKPLANVTVVAEELSTPKRRGITAFLSTTSGAFDIRVRSNGRYVLAAKLTEGQRVIARGETEIIHVGDSNVENVHLRLKPAASR